MHAVCGGSLPEPLSRLHIVQCSKGFVVDGIGAMKSALSSGSSSGYTVQERWLRMNLLQELKRLKRIKLVCIDCKHTRHFDRTQGVLIWRQIQRMEALPVTWNMRCHKCGYMVLHFIDWPDEGRA